MGLEKLIALGATLAILAASTGHLPKAILAVHIAQLRLIKRSQASNWSKAQLLPESKTAKTARRNVSKAKVNPNCATD